MEKSVETRHKAVVYTSHEMKPQFSLLISFLKITYLLLLFIMQVKLRLDFTQLLISFSFGLKVQRNTADSHYTVEPRFTGHQLNTDTSALLRTIILVPGESKPLHFLEIQLA